MMPLWKLTKSKIVLFLLLLNMKGWFAEKKRKKNQEHKRIAFAKLDWFFFKFLHIASEVKSIKNRKKNRGRSRLGIISVHPPHTRLQICVWCFACLIILSLYLLLSPFHFFPSLSFSILSLFPFRFFLSFLFDSFSLSFSILSLFPFRFFLSFLLTLSVSPFPLYLHPRSIFGLFLHSFFFSSRISFVLFSFGRFHFFFLSLSVS